MDSNPVNAAELQTKWVKQMRSSRSPRPRRRSKSVMHTRSEFITTIISPHDTESRKTPPNHGVLLHRAALKTHPDRVGTDSPEREERTRKFQLVNDAYYTLSDPTRRRDYDAQRRLFTGSSTSSSDPFADADEEIPPQGTGAQNAYSWAWNYFTNNQSGAAGAADREQTENAQFEDVFEEMMRDEGMAEDGTNKPTNRFWSLLGGASGGALGFIVANVPGAVAGAVAGNRLGAVRDAKGKSVYSVFLVSPHISLSSFILHR